MNAETATAGHNQHSADSRMSIIKDCSAKMRRIKSSRKELNEEAGEIRQRLKDANIDAKSWEVGLRLADMEDAVARDAFLEGLRETAQALGIGGQLDWVTVAAAQNEPAPIDPKAAHMAGEQAGLDGKDFETNPYGDDTEAHVQWQAGWKKGQEQNVVTMGNADAVAAS